MGRERVLRPDPTPAASRPGGHGWVEVERDLSTLERAGVEIGSGGDREFARVLWLDDGWLGREERWANERDAG